MLLYVILATLGGLLLWLIINDAEQKEESNQNERDLARWTKVLGLGTIMLFVATAISTYFLRNTDDAVREQLLLQRAEERPWIAIHVTDPQAEIYKTEEKEWNFSLWQAVTNIGKQPALNISVHCFFNENADKLEQAVEEARLSPQRSGYTVFPSQTLRIPAACGEIIQSYANDEQKLAAAVKYAGFVEYFSTPKGEPHFTPYAYNIWLTPDSTDVRGFKADISEDVINNLQPE